MKISLVLLLACALNILGAEQSAVVSTNGLYPQGFIPGAAKTYDDPALLATNVPTVREISKGIYAVGKVEVNRQKRTVSFPIVLNMSEGPMEYLIVTTYGKVHESLFRTDVEPFHIHTGMLLLGARGSSALTGIPVTSEPNYNPSKTALEGDPVTVEFSWQENGKTITRTPGDFLTVASSPAFDPDGKAAAKPAKPGKLTWVYNGSGVFENRFVAQMSGSIISLITDASALVNNIAEGHENDDMWAIAPAKLPPVAKVINVTFKLTPLPRK